MRILKPTKSFRKDYKRIKNDENLVGEMTVIINQLANDTDLADELHDHDLSGNWVGHRECHIRPDFLLIYRKIELEDGTTYLFMARCGNHSQLFG